MKLTPTQMAALRLVASGGVTYTEDVMFLRNGRYYVTGIAKVTFNSLRTAGMITTYRPAPRADFVVVLTERGKLHMPAQ